MGTIHATMGDVDLTIGHIVRYGTEMHSASKVITCTDDGSRRATFPEVGARAAQLAHGLRELGVDQGERVGTLLFNTQEHQELYLAVPAMGAVLHTLNFRLSPDQLAYIINHADDAVIFVEAVLAPLLAGVLPRCPRVRTVVVVGDVPPGSELPDGGLLYETVLGGQPDSFDWPDLDERSAAAMCYTSGTTGDPKGVVYSHRSTFLHSLTFGGALSLVPEDRILAVVPMFHVNAWGIPYSAWMSGIDLLMPSRFMQAEPLCRFIAAERATFSAGVPTVWADVLRYGEEHAIDLSSLRSILVGGSALPVWMIDAFRDRYGIDVDQGWGMTETSPAVCVGRPPKGSDPAKATSYRSAAGRRVVGTELRIVDDEEQEVPADGTTAGEIQVRGPWVTDGYHELDAPDRIAVDKAGRRWLRTGDLGTIDSERVVRITDRLKDVIKSGGEWISSVELENVIAAHPDVVEAAVIGVPDTRWFERPLAVVVRRAGATIRADDLAKHVASSVPTWWTPERWAFTDELPKTSTLKFDKRALRSHHAAGGLMVESVAGTTLPDPVD
jgi:fatty-acyl-CoA synthase